MMGTYLKKINTFKTVGHMTQQNGMKKTQAIKRIE